MKDMRFRRKRHTPLELSILAPHLNFLTTKIDQQPNVKANGGQIIDELYFMIFRQYLYGLQFHHYSLINEKVGQVITQNDPIINDLKARFADIRNARLIQFVGQCLVINVLQEAGAKHPMNLNGATNDPLRQWIVFHRKDLFMATIHVFHVPPV